MTRLFILLYVGVLTVLFLAWYIHGAVLKQRAEADRARVIEEAHGGGSRLVASQLDAAAPESRDQLLNRLRARFDYPVDVIPIAELPSSLQRRLSGGVDVAHYRLSERSSAVVARLSNGSEVVRLGPFPDYDLKEIEEAIGGWMRLTADALESSQPQNRGDVLKELLTTFDFPIELVSREDLPDWPRGRIVRGEDVAFYPHEEDRWFAASPLSNGDEVIRFGPFPNFE
jgi:hypothetical protein